jgi:putative transposase
LTIIKRGVPEAIFVDNGKIFVSRQLRVACATLGVRHLTAAPYSPEAKGKIEKLTLYSPRSSMSLRFGAWVEEFYHNRPHSSLDGKSPLEVYRSSIKNIRTETYEAITEAFKHSAERKVDHTGCFSFEGQTFRCGVDHAGKRVLLRYDPSDLSSVEVFYKNERVGIATPIKVCVQGGSDKQTSGPDSVSFDKLMVERQQQSLERRLGAISFSGLEEDKDV